MVEIKEEDDEIDRLNDFTKFGRKIFPHVYTQVVGWLVGPLILWNAFSACNGVGATVRFGLVSCDFPILAFT